MCGVKIPPSLSLTLTHKDHSCYWGDFRIPSIYQVTATVNTNTCTHQSLTESSSSLVDLSLPWTRKYPACLPSVLCRHRKAWAWMVHFHHLWGQGSPDPLQTAQNVVTQVTLERELVIPGMMLLPFDTQPFYCQPAFQITLVYYCEKYSPDFTLMSALHFVRMSRK